MYLILYKITKNEGMILYVRTISSFLVILYNIKYISHD